MKLSRVDGRQYIEKDGKVHTAFAFQGAASIAFRKAKKISIHVSDLSSVGGFSDFIDSWFGNFIIVDKRARDFMELFADSEKLNHGVK